VCEKANVNPAVEIIPSVEGQVVSAHALFLYFENAPPSGCDR
jgi:hypothetical protein